ncbi:MAG: hypothetical protein J0M04_00130 [Verrucomicrobia bacterium]|nr:hypothetical protein [Verrucomicrobiota bacterium]
MITAILVALIWRVEVELRGWDGLDWIGYRHLAIPLGGLLFLGWVWLVSRSHDHSPKIIGLVAIWGVIASFILHYAASAYFVGGMTAISYMMTLGALFYHVHWLSPVIWGTSILALYAGYRLLFRFPPSMWLGGFVLWMGSWHFGLIVIIILPERGYEDLIHSLKTGWMIPFCVAAVGMPLLALEKEPSEQAVARQPA